MRVLIAFDKFKDALTARQACATAATALREKHPDWTLDLCPLTDGGEGFCETLTVAAGGRLEVFSVSGPRGAAIQAPAGFVQSRNLPDSIQAQLSVPPSATLAVIGLASASGIELLRPGQRDPWQTTTYGTGELIHAVARQNVSALLLGLGGSATNDLGLGALAALGFKFSGRPTPSTWSSLSRMEGKINLPPLFIACDVTNPLLGPHGATATFGPQKGLKPDDLARLETEMARMAALLCTACGKSMALADTPGAGAAGGLGFGLMVAAGAKLVPGFDLVSTWLDLPARLAAADLVLTGEGRFDATSLAGKGPGSLVREARRMGKTVHVFAGSLGGPADQALHAITPPGLPLGEALTRTAELLAAAVRQEL